MWAAAAATGMPTTAPPRRPPSMTLPAPAPWAMAPGRQQRARAAAAAAGLLLRRRSPIPRPMLRRSRSMRRAACRRQSACRRTIATTSVMRWTVRCRASCCRLSPSLCCLRRWLPTCARTIPFPTLPSTRSSRRSRPSSPSAARRICSPCAFDTPCARRGALPQGSAASAAPASGARLPCPWAASARRGFVGAAACFAPMARDAPHGLFPSPDDEKRLFCTEGLPSGAMRCIKHSSNRSNMRHSLTPETAEQLLPVEDSRVPADCFRGSGDGSRVFTLCTLPFAASLFSTPTIISSL